MRFLIESYKKKKKKKCKNNNYTCLFHCSDIWSLGSYLDTWPVASCTNTFNMIQQILILKAQSIVADDILKFFIHFFLFFRKISLDISCESSAWLIISMKCHDLFSLKNNKKYNLSSAAVVIGALRVSEGKMCDPYNTCIN